MDAFVWDKNFTTGLDVVDRQHSRLVGLINQLGESLIAGEEKGPEALQAIFDQLTDYARYHFAEEESLMQEAGISPRFFDPHRRFHVQFIEQLTTMWDSRGTMAHPAENLHGFLRSWLGFHILGVDQSMARQIALIESGSSPDQAREMEVIHGDNATSALLKALHTLYNVLSEQNRDLALANALLEERVAERTSELAQANVALTELNRRLESLSNSDGLLGIANRRYFDATLDEEWRRASRERQPLSLLMIDVDHFKRFNDSYGHQAGDSCLQSVVEAAQAAIKRPGDLLARYGGEELAVILPNTDGEGAERLAQGIRRELAAQQIPHADSPVADRVTVSIGIATLLPGEQIASGQLIAAADRGLYRAKHNGRDSVCSG